MIDCRPAFRKPLADVTPRLSTTFVPYVERPILVIGLILTILFWVLVVWFIGLGAGANQVDPDAPMQSTMHVKLNAASI